MRDFNPQEYKVMALRECPVPAEMLICDTPDKVAAYWRMHIEKHPYYNPECECMAVLLLNARSRVKGHQFLTMGTIDTLIISPLMVFRAAVISSASAIVLVHNHPSGDPSPSDADVKTTRDLMRAGQLMKIEVLDHVIIGAGNPSYHSLRSHGYFAS